MEPAVRSPRTESAIITDRAQNGDFGLPRLPYSRLPKGIGRGNPGAGNGIFGCRDGRLKIGLRDRKYHQRPKERNDTGENPHRNGLFGADPEICGLEGLDGGRTRARTWDPMIKRHPPRLDISSKFSQLRQNPNIRDQWLTAKNPTMWARQCWRIDASEASGRSPVSSSEGVTREATL